ncbi:hypothetical protein DesyoDRAFT_3399 [Desulfosporosinus youngiae DSM 17734]|uniref:Uncharacterized protein n=1 Tax=Desulfosporosinus youngiae DSM 17734 TaxID=768710 RepID=H5XVX0_9FIRM|nr:hypothetical protein DesyoDRAFT_3399 [Desulfosporosinus youngiae DSM 17734]
MTTRKVRKEPGYFVDPPTSSLYVEFQFPQTKTFQFRSELYIITTLGLVLSISTTALAAPITPPNTIYEL